MKNTSSHNLHCKETPRPNYLHNSCSRQETKQINIVLFCEKCEGIFKSVHKENEALVYRSYKHREKCGSQDVLKREITRSVIQGP